MLELVTAVYDANLVIPVRFIHLVKIDMSFEQLNLFISQIDYEYADIVWIVPEMMLKYSPPFLLKQQFIIS